MLCGPSNAAPALNLAADEWFRMEILAVGNDLTIKINDRSTAHYVVAQKPSTPYGFIALQAMDPRSTVVRFRSIEVKRLPPTPQPPAPPAKNKT